MSPRTQTRTLSRRKSRLPSARELLEEGTRALQSSGVAFGHGTANALDECAWLLLFTLKVPYDALNRHLDDRPAAATVEIGRAHV